MWLSLGDRGEFPLGNGELEGVGPGEGRGERVPISMARSSVQARPWLLRKSSVSLSTSSSLVRWGTSQIRFTTCREEREVTERSLRQIKMISVVSFGACCSP